MSHVNQMADFHFRRSHRLTHTRMLERSAKEKTNFQDGLLRPHKKVARPAREHYGMVGSINALFAEISRCFTQPLPCIHQITRQVAREVLLCSRPAVVK